MARVQLVMSEYLRHLAWRDADCACNTTSQHSLLLCSPRRTFVSIGCISVLPTWKSARNRVESSQLEPERRDRIQFISDSFQDKSTTDRHVPGRSFGKFRRWSTLCSLHRNRQIWSMRCSVRRRSGKPGQRRTGNSVWRGPWDVKDKNWNKHWTGQKRADESSKQQSYHVDRHFSQLLKVLLELFSSLKVELIFAGFRYVL